MSADNDLREAVEERLAARIVEARRRRDGRTRRLAELAARRQAGLAARHARKLAGKDTTHARTRQSTPGDQPD